MDSYHRDLREAEMEEKQAALIASRLPDRSQFAVKQGMTELRSEVKQGIAELKSEVKQGIAELRSEVKQDIAELKSDLMRWQWVQLGVIVILLTALRFIPLAA